MTTIGILVPTLGRRPDYLKLCLQSIQKAAGPSLDVRVYIVAPTHFNATELHENKIISGLFIDPGQGLPAAINFGISSMPEEIEFVNWLGDDDLLEAGSLGLSIAKFREDASIVMVYGQCNYINKEGHRLWLNKSGWWASKILRFGPDLVPQPGALFRRKAFLLVGGLDEKYKWAFDYDLFIKFLDVGKIKYIPQPLGSFRWHAESLSVEFRLNSVREASLIRSQGIPKPLRPFFHPWNRFVQYLTFAAASSPTFKGTTKE